MFYYRGSNVDCRSILVMKSVSECNMLLCTKFRVNQTINRPDIAEKKTIFIMASVCHVEFAKLWHFVM